MIVMSKQKPKTDEPKKPARAGSQLGLVIDEEIRAAMDAYMAHYNATADHPASIRSTAEAAFKMFLKEKGFWPWPKT